MAPVSWARWASAAPRATWKVHSVPAVLCVEAQVQKARSVRRANANTGVSEPWCGIATQTRRNGSANEARRSFVCLLCPLVWIPELRRAQAPVRVRLCRTAPPHVCDVARVRLTQRARVAISKLRDDQARQAAGCRRPPDPVTPSALTAEQGLGLRQSGVSVRRRRAEESSG